MKSQALTDQPQHACVVQEVAVLAKVAMDCELLLSRCFENYHSLSETSISGILEGGQATTVIPAPALQPAVKLCSTSHPCPLKSRSSTPAALRCFLGIVDVLCTAMLAYMRQGMYCSQPRYRAHLSFPSTSCPDSKICNRVHPAANTATSATGIIREHLEPLDQVWLAERFSTAATRRYHRLAGAADDQHPFGIYLQ